MLRSLSLAAALLILPGMASTQEVAQTQVGTHEVVKGNTLWALAERYLKNPFRWPMIYEANRDKIEDPHWIYPGQVFVIPGLEGQEAQVTVVSVVTDVSEKPEVAPAPPAASGRTRFYRGASAARSVGVGEVGSGTSAELSRAAVPMGLVYASSWMVQPDVETEWVGTVEDFSEVHVARSPGDRALWLERLVIAPKEGVTLRVGDLLQSFVVARAEMGWGTVIQPTGILAVTAVEENGMAALLSTEYGPVRMGQKVRFAPDYDLEPGVFPESVQSNVSGTILGFAEQRAIQGMGSEAYLDLGAREGIDIGDEFLAYVGDSPEREAAVLQVILANEHTSTVRILSLTRPGLSRGDGVRLVGKMR